MTDTSTPPAVDSTAPAAANNQPVQVIVQVPQPRHVRGWIVRSMALLLLMSIMMNYVLFSTTAQLTQTGENEFVSGNEDAEDQIVVIDINGTIMPPFTERILSMIERARKDDSIKGVLLSIDSPGGLVADSHQIYHRLEDLSKTKPIWVSMKRIAASGGIYVAMGVGPTGRIFAEPTTWTGSIGVIIPRYDLSALAKQYGVASDSLTTGEFKDSMNPFKPLSDHDRQVWGEILEESFDRFVTVIATGRPALKRETIRKELATGQIFTANQAVKSGLIDDIKFEDDVLDEFQKHLKLAEVKVVRYRHPMTMVDLLLGQASKPDPHAELTNRLLESTVPRAMYYFSWLPALPE